MKNKDYVAFMALAMSGMLGRVVNHTHTTYHYNKVPIIPKCKSRDHREKSESKPLPAQSYDRKKHYNKRAKRRKKGGNP